MATAVYYIRLLKLPPNAIVSNQPFTVVWTVTNDLGEIQFWEPMTVTCHLEGGAYFTVGKKASSKTLDLEYDPVKSGGVVRSTLTIAGVANTQLQIILTCASACSTPQTHDVWLHGRQHATAKEWVVPVWSQLLTIVKKPTGQTTHEYERRVVIKGNNGTTVVRIQESTGTSMAHHVWDSGLMLCHYLAHFSSKPHRRYKNILELGSGTGIAGIYAAYTLRPDHIYLTDLPEALADIDHNVALQKDMKKLVRTTVTALEWGTHIDNITGPIDLVILADVVYNSLSHDVLIQTLEQLVERNPDLTVLIGYKQRSHAEERAFFDKIQDKGWSCNQDTTTVDCSPCEIYWVTKSL